MIDWMDIKNTPPPYNTEVLFFTERGEYTVGEYIDCGSYLRLKMNGASKPLKFWGDRPIKWMPLPPPPTM